jgi:hypothetical protein
MNRLRNPQQEATMTHSNDKQHNIQGEGDKEAARRYDEATQEFVRSGKLEQAEKQAAEQDPREAEQAEREGRERAKEDDPAVHRDYHQPTKD